MTDSHIRVTDSGTAFVGPDATKLFAAKALLAAINLYRRTGMKAARQYTPARMAHAAGYYTGKSYSARQLDKAAVDLLQWIVAMQSALPVEDNRKGGAA